MSDVTSCVVVGGGVAGLWTSWALAQAGIEVTLLEATATGAGASWGNAGWVCPAQAGPVPEPGIIAHGLRDMVKRDSTLHFTPAAAARMGPWIARFATYCNEQDYARGVAALSTLGYPSFKLIEHLGLDEHVDKTGLLAISSRREDIEKFVAKIAPLTDFGQEVSGILDGDAVQDVDPIVPRGQTAVMVSNHWQIVPHRYTAGLRDKVLQAGVTILENHAVSGFDASNGRVRAVHADRQSFRGDAVVLASGVETNALAKRLGHRLPVVGGKGYSIDVTPESMPRQAIDSLDEHLALSPMGQSLRIVGGMEFSMSPERVSPARVASMRRSAARVVGAWSQESKPWTGLRPVAPDGLPLLGRIDPRSNVFVATGYSMLGMTISPAAGTHLADLITSGDDGTTGAFSPQRFMRRGRTGRRAS